VTTTIAIDGWPVALSDTAGLRAPSGMIEEEGIARARAAAAAADLPLWLLDGSAEPIFPEGVGIWRPVITKIDLPPAWDWSRAPEALHTSALTRAGLSELCEAISRGLVPDPPAPGGAIPFSPEWSDRVNRALALVEQNRAVEAGDVLAES